jgi:hypothetical protein
MTDFKVDINLMAWAEGREATVVADLLDSLSSDLDGIPGAAACMQADYLRDLCRWAEKQTPKHIDIPVIENIDRAIDWLVEAAQEGDPESVAAAREQVDDLVDRLETKLNAVEAMGKSASPRR